MAHKCDDCPNLKTGPNATCCGRPPVAQKEFIDEHRILLANFTSEENMTVGQLIEILSRLPADTKVTVKDDSIVLTYSFLSFVYPDGVSESRAAYYPGD